MRQGKRGHWHVLYHRMYDAAGPLDPGWGQWSVRPPGAAIPSPGWAGGHAFSRDGFTWSEWSRCYNTSIALTNGSTVEARRRERPKLLFDERGRPTHLCNGGGMFMGAKKPSVYTVAVPINH